jgi:hypothetical protein
MNKTKQPTTEEINQAISAFQGLCWHDWYQDVAGFRGISRYHCLNCPEKVVLNVHENLAENPDYTSADSPHRLLDDAVAKVLDEKSVEVFYAALSDAIGISLNVNGVFAAMKAWATATPLQISTAIFRCIQQCK